ncbi:sensor histidine kinase [Ruminococcus flavefaciens]|uniref:sensor histidine kinase n=1 Tax=Ruminococcus flavefaciens TaxID=1265 RepID=UPI001FA74FA9|nr:HAMP domain-containing sensor histidine kinase [Ruminococcus flavefaciens]
MACAIIFLTVKVCLMKKSAKEISAELHRIINGDTNGMIGISSRDKDMRSLADDINKRLKEVRDEQLRYELGNTELKTAITNISHDLRTPLTAICGYLDIMQKNSAPEKQERYLAIIRERADMMKQLTEELFSYSVIATGDTDMEREEVFVNQLLAESISSFYPALKSRGIEPRIELTEQRILRSVNKASLSRVFSNLLNNAVKYSDGDLHITLSDSGIITFANRAEELSAIDVEQLFDRFYTVEAAHHSTGLGLSIARTLVERMGGKINAEYSGGQLIISIGL